MTRGAIQDLPLRETLICKSFSKIRKLKRQCIGVISNKAYKNNYMYMFAGSFNNFS